MERNPHFQQSDLDTLIHRSVQANNVLSYINDMQANLTASRKVVFDGPGNGGVSLISQAMVAVMTETPPDDVPGYEFEISHLPQILANFYPQNLVDHQYEIVRCIFGVVMALRHAFTRLLSSHAAALLMLGACALEAPDGINKNQLEDYIEPWVNSSKESSKPLEQSLAMIAKVFPVFSTGAQA